MYLVFFLVFLSVFLKVSLVLLSPRDPNTETKKVGTGVFLEGYLLRRYLDP